jgi:8-oxo-dGTP pyrophosphatase MutT (NUDIX family)
MRLFCFIFRPRTRGVCIAVWHHNQVLIVKNSYYHKYTLPGGYIKRHEKACTAAVRELKEEVGLAVKPAQLRSERRVALRVNFKREILTFFDITLSQAPAVRIDNREVIWAEFMPLSKALSLNLSVAAHACLNNWRASEQR